MTVAAAQPREDADVESSSETYARRFDGPVGQWFVDSQTRITLECLAGLPAGATFSTSAEATPRSRLRPGGGGLPGDGGGQRPLLR